MEQNEPKQRPEQTAEAAGSRRNFLTRAMACLLGGITGIVPVLTGLFFFADPLRSRRKQAEGNSDDEFLKVASVDELLVGKPRRVVVVNDRTDAWNLYRQDTIGVVFLLRTADGQVSALNANCPHLGCQVSFKSDDQLYRCPCHDSSFATDGEIANDTSPSPRGLDPLDTEVRDGSEVWVKFQNFVAGTAERNVE